MAAVQPPRTRSARLVAGFTNKSAQHAPSPAPQVHHGPPALSIFLTNLNLLDLDQHEDWPDIRAETFATGGSSAQGLKKRVQCVEWALFQLFALWDPEETKKKLKPFFPPIDQSQSVNLRAALLRALDQAKKNGVLGRDAVIRKTMLDECRGERLEEVLAAFSSAVLKHVIAQEVSTSEHKALALGLALEDRGYKSDNTDLNTMVLAHKVAISRILNSKVAASSRFHDFSDLLTVKEKGIARRKEALQALEGGKTISEDARREMWRTLRNNWSGNERWMETLLYGDACAKKDGLLGMPFDRVWRRVQQGRLDELEEHGSGLLEQLDTRVRVQKERLEKWQSFRNELSIDQPKPSPSKVKQRQKENGIDFGFGAHEALQLGRVSPKKATFGKPKLIQEYDDLVSTLEQELQSTKPQKSSALDFLQRPFSHNPPSINIPAPEPEQEEEVISELEDEDGLPESPIKSFKSKLDLSKRFPVRPKLAHTSDSFASISSSTRSLRKPSEDEARILRASSVERTSSPEPEDEPVMASPRPEYDVSPQLTPQLSPQLSPPPSPLPLQESPELMPAEPPGTQEMADQILESMNMASPSPVKRSRPRPRHTLSLAERTRLTMARESFDYPDNEVLDLSPPTSAEPVSAEDPTQSVDEEFDLIARTKKSMAGFDKARKKAQMERRRSLRKPKAPTKKEDDYFPKVDEETTICTDELMAQEDMEAVFRSRPKIKASPLPSPTRDWSDDEYM
ncbi:HAUS augmin-like complex subunit 6 N-terminus-domain-containing protein [Fusarium avenaceum]|nr:HAUS augmin-like complex subunit 6 N-terminus-domain-containing protein [Fusarium avenaceum]KAH6949352.1 HAUS augmin-like complex subunit 6 N-terminus-domain-containing protein [Fusarium avenaceum]